MTLNLMLGVASGVLHPAQGCKILVFLGLKTDIQTLQGLSNLELLYNWNSVENIKYEIFISGNCFIYFLLICSDFKAVDVPVYVYRSVVC